MKPRTALRRPRVTRTAPDAATVPVDHHDANGEADARSRLSKVVTGTRWRAQWTRSVHPGGGDMPRIVLPLRIAAVGSAVEVNTVHHRRPVHIEVRHFFFGQPFDIPGHGETPSAWLPSSSSVSSVTTSVRRNAAIPRTPQNRNNSPSHPRALYVSHTRACGTGVSGPT